MAEKSGGDITLLNAKEICINDNSEFINESVEKISALPWIRCNDSATLTENPARATADLNPGEYVLQTLFTEFTILAQKKIDRLMTDPSERPLSKSLQRGEDPQFDQLLCSLSSVAEHCLSSLLKTLFLWYERQSSGCDDATPRSPSRTRNGTESPRPGSRASFKEKDVILWERRNMSVEFIFCLVLIEVLKQLTIHPVDDQLVQYIEDLAFKHFKEHNVDASAPLVVCNQGIITALYAEVIGVLAQTRFQSIRKRFVSEYKENVGNPQILLNITMGLKFIRFKLYPVDEVEESFMFLQECATLFLERSLDKEVKYAFANLFVEILIPVAAQAKREYNIPAVKKFVDLLYKDAFDMSKKAKHSLAIYPLVTALLCISQKQFFLTNWGQFLNMCLSCIKSRDSKMQRMAMECLYRLLWVYIIRIKCEAHTITINRLRSIVDTLFPKNSRTVLPRNIPLTIFVKIIQFIAQEKLDFAMQDIIFDLLNIGKSVKQLNPERMNIGLRAFLVIADNLQRKEGSPPMPSTIGHLPSGNTLKVKKTFTKLTEEAARNIGVVTYYTSVRRALDTILKTLDSQVGKSMTLINPQMVNKEVNDFISGERKPKIDLFRTCVAAIPKCIPDGMGKEELVELISRATLHVDEELRNLAFAALQGLIVDFPEYRHDIIKGYINFTLKEVPDSFPQIIENSIRMLAQLLIQWRNAVSMPAGSNTDKYLEMSMHCSKSQADSELSSIHTLHATEGFALAMLCSNKAMIRKLAFTLLKEVRILYKALYNEGKDELVIDVLENSAAYVVEKALANVSGYDKSSLGLSPHIDLQLLAEKSALLAEKQEHNIANTINKDLWSHCLSGFFDKVFLSQKNCSCMFHFTWPYINNRIFVLYSTMDPNADFDSMKSRTSVMSFRAPRVQPNLSDVCLWRNYLIYLFCAPPPTVLVSNISTIASISSNDTDIKTDHNKLPPDFVKLSDIFRTTVLLIKSEIFEIREAAVIGLGKTNPLAHPQLIEELQPLIREVLDKKTDGVRKKRKKDLLRLQVARIMAANAEQGCFRHSLSQPDNKGVLHCLGEYIEGMRSILEQENEKDDGNLMLLRLNFSKFLHKMIKSIPISMQGSLLRNQGRHHLFLLLAGWCGHFNVNNLGTTTQTGHHSVELEFSALEAMCALLCCGQVFDQKALTVSNGYLYKLLDTMFQSNNTNVTKLGQETVELLLENNESIPALLNFVVDRCYTGTRGISNGCFLALANVFSKHSYSCQLISLLCVVIFKTGDPCQEISEKAAQLIYILDRRFFGYMIPFRSGSSECTNGNQTFSMHLAYTHPELTLPLISEITLRFETATMVGQRCLLYFLSPWLENIELVELSSTPVSSETGEALDLNDIHTPTHTQMLRPIVLQGGGWGSSQASQMVLNNLFYLTVKYEELYSKEIEKCWSSLCIHWENNIARIIDYLIIMAGLCGTSVLIHAKKICVYLARTKSTATVCHLTEEIKLTDVVSNSWDRIPSPPYFRCLSKLFSPIKLSSPHSSSLTQKPQEGIKEDENTLIDANSSTLLINRFGNERSSFGSSGKSFSENVSESAKASQIAALIEQQKKAAGSSEMWIYQWVMKVDLLKGDGLPLPMPHKFQYFAPITQLFPLTSPPAQLYRCNFALMLLTEIISDQRDIPWVEDLPLLLHVSFLGLDHPKPLVYESCKRLIINLIVVLVCSSDHSTIAKALMDFQTVSSTVLSQIASCTTVPNDGDLGTEETLGASGANVETRVNGPELEENGMSISEKARHVIEYLAKSGCKPLWTFEDITPRNCTIKSSNHLESFLHIIISLFDDALPSSSLRGRWGRESLYWATSCSSRHYAGRSFQIFRSLKVPLSWPMLSDILQRLVESVADSGEDVQGYFMEILLTFLAEVDYAFNPHPKSILKASFVLPDSFKFSSVKDLSVSNLPAGHHRRSRSTDCSHEYKRYRSLSDFKVSISDDFSDTPTVEFSENELPQSPYDILARFFWIGVSLLESDYEHEFLLAIKLIDKVFDKLNLEDAKSVERVEKVFDKINWLNFPGLQSLLLKGLTSSGTAEQTQYLLSKLTTMNSISVISPNLTLGLSLNVISLLPRLINSFDAPDEFCQVAALRIVQACESNLKLKDLATLMVMYIKKEYSKSVHFWIEVVCKNLVDAFPNYSVQLLALLVEMLEQGPPIFHQSVLNIICAILKYSDVTSPGLKQFHSYLLRVITSHVKDVNLWKESLNILKLVVSNSSHIQQAHQSFLRTTSSQLVQPRGSLGSIISLAPKPSRVHSMSFGESSWSLSSDMFKKDLPGRTLEFSFNVSNTPVIGARYNLEELKDHIEATPGATTAAPCWRKPHGSQKRTRERLVQLLPMCGHKGGLKQSLSVIFSSSSELDLERAMSSEDGSGEEPLGENIEVDFSGQRLTNIFTDFDFLDDELDKDIMLEVGTFGWTSNSELADEFSECGHISPCGSESDNVTSVKDDYISADEEEVDLLQKSLPEFSLISLKEEREEELESKEDDREEDEEDEDDIEKRITLEEDQDDTESPTSLPLDPVDSETSCLMKTNDEINIGILTNLLTDPGDSLLTDNSVDNSAVDHVGMVFSHTDENYSLTSQSSLDSIPPIENITTIALPEPVLLETLKYEEIPKLWSKFVRQLVSHPSVEEALDSFPCFPLILKAWNMWIKSLIDDAQMFFRLIGVIDIAGKLSLVKDELEKNFKVPYLFVDEEVFSATKLLSKHRLTTLKLNVALQCLQEKRQLAIQQLEMLQQSFKAKTISSEQNDFFFHSNFEESAVHDLCLYLYHVHMQYILCLEIYSAYIEKTVTIVRNTNQHSDLTTDLISMRSELITTQKSLNDSAVLRDTVRTATNSEDIFNDAKDSVGLNNVADFNGTAESPDTFTNTSNNENTFTLYRDISSMLLNAVANRQFDEAISIIRSFRENYQNSSSFEVKLEEEIETILSIYAKNILKSRSGVFALLGSYDHLVTLCDKLNELLADFLSSAYERSDASEILKKEQPDVS
ncbi:protein furry homolog-like isoform X1 [Hydra vulgaris]|uniref:protein furry homolog-like isoform X1 n=1 Tax=Hydra vulgaris TaxID=6087 RepID=UPI001F5F2E7E|nr:protein furry homolog-like [Hydra vulgaris]